VPQITDVAQSRQGTKNLNLHLSFRHRQSSAMAWQSNAKPRC